MHLMSIGTVCAAVPHLAECQCCGQLNGLSVTDPHVQVITHVLLDEQVNHECDALLAAASTG